MGLDEYRRKRHFSRTPEPKGSAQSPKERLRFVVQKHAARRLHYDLRLEYDGVLKSWAVPKGPCLDPAQKRLAVHVEDHPLEYVDFEGVIPAGEYGAGTVMVWDTGFWNLVDDGRSYEKGELKFELDGHKLQGRWMLVWTGKRAGDEKQWLLFKERDEAARPIDKFDVLTAYPDSVLSQQSIEQIAENPQRVWTGADTARANDSPAPPDKVARPSQSPSTRSTSRARNRRISIAKQPGARKATMPASLAPCLAVAARQAPTGDQWVHEIKFDGYRMMGFIDGDRVRFVTRNGNDWTDRFPRLVNAARQLPVHSAIIDGEFVVMAEDGTTDFQRLQNTIHSGDDRTIRYYVFDLLYLNGYDIRSMKLGQRKELLDSVMEHTEPSGAILLSEHIQGDGPVVFQESSRLGAEGIVSKRLDRTYVSGRSENWLKIKSVQSEEFFVVGFTDSTASRNQIGALVLGSHDQQGRLTYVGKVGSGFSEETLDELRERLKPLTRDESPLEDTRGETFPKRQVHWVDPTMVVEVEFGSWTNDGRIRFGRYRGIRDDVSPGSKVEVSSASEAGTTLLDELPDELHDIALTHPDRVVYPQRGVTKLGLMTYYAQVAKWMLPHVIGRPLSLLRCPKGIGERCFFQKRKPAGLPECVGQIEFTKPGHNPHKNLVISDMVGLLALVQFGVVEFHLQGCRVDQMHRPDRIVFDLDPDPDLDWSKVGDAAFILRELLTDAGLVSFVKTTGGNGLHVVVPIDRRTDWKIVKEFSKRVALKMGGQWPGRYTSNSQKNARRGKIYVDHLRNTLGATAISPYSARARESAGVAVPLAWNELPTLSSGSAYTIENVLRRLRHLNDDPWAEISSIRQTLSKRVLQRFDV